MKAKRLRFGKGFRIAFNTPKAQAAEMVIAPAGPKAGRETVIVVATSGSMSYPGRVSPS
jgi:hypothetical protein